MNLHFIWGKLQCEAYNSRQFPILWQWRWTKNSFGQNDTHARRIVSPCEIKWTLGTALHSLRKFYCRTFWVQAHKYPSRAHTIYIVAVVLTELCDFEAFFKVTDKIYTRTTSSQKQVCAFSAFLIRFFFHRCYSVFSPFAYFFLLHVWFNVLNRCISDKQHVWYVNCRVVGLVSGWILRCF